MYQEYLNQLHVSIFPLTTEELRLLLNDDEKLEEKVDEVLENLKAQKDSLFEENREKAERNIEKEPEIIELKGKLAELTEKGKRSCEAVQEKLAAIKDKDKSGNISQETALALLQTAAAESEEASENLVKKFTDNELTVDSFLEEFLNARKIMHLRKLKAEKMQELMRRQALGTSNPTSRGVGYGNVPASNFYLPPHPPTQFGGGTPYPLGPMMPMPPPRPY
uniref:VPS37 C-terminal domain-containing protein n=1 Tax=Glossina austeni TaxID=7395 RepID=A0A1A9VAE1_GLOAU